MEADASNGVRRFCQVIGVKPEKKEAYLKLHRNVWPGVRENIRRANIRNYSLFCMGDLLVQYFEYAGDDLEADFMRDADRELTRKWESICRPCHTPLPGRQAGEWWADMEEVLHND